MEQWGHKMKLELKKSMSNKVFIILGSMVVFYFYWGIFYWLESIKSAMLHLRCFSLAPIPLPLNLV